MINGGGAERTLRRASLFYSLKRLFVRCREQCSPELDFCLAILSQEITCGRKGLGFCADPIRFHWPAQSAITRHSYASSAMSREFRRKRTFDIYSRAKTLRREVSVSQWPQTKLSPSVATWNPLRCGSSTKFLVGSSPSDQEACLKECIASGAIDNPWIPIILSEVAGFVAA